VEAALTNRKKVLLHFSSSVADFNRHVVIKHEDYYNGEKHAWNDTAEVALRGGNTTELERCGICECTKAPCGKCANCADDATGTGCFQKMCYKLSVCKAEQAIDFPMGWRFYFAEKCNFIGQYSYKSVHGLWIQSPGNKKFRFVEATMAF
jgi:hypothetical protein